MRAILLDTNAYSNLLRGDDRVLEVLTDARTVLMSPIAIGELLSGFRNGSRFRANQSLLKEFLSSPNVTTVAITAETSEVYSLLHAALKKKGQPIPTNDLWIAAQAVEQGAVLITYDGHFSSIDKLKTWAWQ